MASYSNYRQYSVTKYICNNNSGSQGPQGDRGPTGAIGPAGLQGATGATGARGPQGFCCVGATGATGPQGAAGPPGGLQGLQGIQGPAGTGYTSNTTSSSPSTVLTSQPDFSSPAATFPFNGLPSPTMCSISWSIHESISDSTSNFCITFSDGTNEYQPIICNKNNPIRLLTNGNHTTGSGNDVIILNGSSTSYTVNIYQSSALFPGSQPTFVVSVTLTTL